jgi:P27 family predicted phage terminase small subunit
LTVADERPLAIYCQAYARWIDTEYRLAHEELTRVSEKGSIAVNPLLWVAQRAAQDTMKFGAEFGLTPASRGRITCDPADDPDRKFAGLLADPA